MIRYVRMARVLHGIDCTVLLARSHQSGFRLDLVWMYVGTGHCGVLVVLHRCCHNLQHSISFRATRLCLAVTCKILACKLARSGVSVCTFRVEASSFLLTCFFWLAIFYLSYTSCSYLGLNRCMTERCVLSDNNNEG